MAWRVITLLPEPCLPGEAGDKRVSLLRFVDPEPAREVGLAWRSNYPRADAFAALGQVPQNPTHTSIEKVTTRQHPGTGEQRPLGLTSA